MRKALYFGSFNPVHFGHISIARYAAQMEETDAVIIIPSPHNPFKDISMLADPAQRLTQVRKAFEGLSPKISVSDIEYRLPEPLYTINTLHALQEAEPETEFILLIGADNIASLERWYKGRQILQEFQVWVYPRKGYNGALLCRECAAGTSVRGIRFLENAPLLDISSTQIRNLRDNKKAAPDMHPGRLQH